MQAGDQTFSTWGWDFEEHSRTKVYYNLKGRRRYNAELSTCFAGEWDGRRAESRATVPTHPAPLSRNCPVVVCSHALTDAKPNRSSLRYHVSKQSHLLSRNQWLSTLMEVLVFFMVLITNKSRIRKSLFSQCCWRFRSGLLGEVLLPTLLTVSAAPGSAERCSQITCGLPGEQNATKDGTFSPGEH